jgi:myo-inositol 2-dehydrogenase/D-chiro-inositol 1-dehydrogenase
VTDTDIRFGILGSGRMGRTYAECLTRHTRGARLIAIAGGSRAPGLARDYRVDHVPTTAALLERGDVDAVIIATPHSRHLEHVLSAFDAGKHVLLEKPMALNTRECDSMLAAGDRAQRFFGILQTARYTAPARAAKRALEEGRIGDVRMLQLNWVEAGYSPATPEGQNTWVSDPAEGGAFLDAGVHAFDLLRWLTTSEPTRVFGRALTYMDPPLPFLSGMAQVTFASGAMASVWISFELPEPGFARHTMHTQIVGSRGVLDLDSYGRAELANATGRAVLVEREPYDINQLTSPGRLEQFIAQTQDFVDALRDGRPAPVSGVDGRAAVAMVEACYQSTISGEVVQIAA